MRPLGELIPAPVRIVVRPYTLAQLLVNGTNKCHENRPEASGLSVLTK